MGENVTQHIDTKEFAANRAKSLMREGNIQNTFKDILEWIKECTLEKTSKAIDFSQSVKEYSKQCAHERIEKDAIGKIYSEIMNLVQRHNKGKIKEEKDTHEDKGVEI